MLMSIAQPKTKQTKKYRDIFIWRLYFEFPEHSASVFALSMREENMERETQCDQIRLMTGREN